MSVDGPTLSVDDVSVHFTDSSGFLGLFGGRQTVRTVDGILLSIGKNDVVTLISESGCGKSTLGKATIDAQEPAHGSITYRGQDIWEAKNSRNPDVPFSEIRRSLQIIHQDLGSALNPNQRILTSLILPLKKWNPSLDEEERRKYIYALFERIGPTFAEDLVERFPHQLLGDEEQRVVLIRSLLLNPDVILADEAISALGVSLQVEMMDLVLELQDPSNTSYVFISHDLSNARYIAEKSSGRITVMYFGHTVKVGPMEQVIGDPRHPYTQTLRWVTPNLYEGDEDDDFPIRKIDILDPTNWPNGCYFHPCCPRAHEVCETNNSDAFEDETGHAARCFRTDEDHEYWNNPSIVDD